MKHGLALVRVLVVAGILWVMLLATDPWTQRLGGY